MIIHIEGPNSLKEYLLLGENLMEGASSCQRCTRKLWRHGGYWRVVQDLDVCGRLWIQRLLCGACRITYSCLFGFVVPKKQYAREVHEQYIERFVMTEESYRQVAWSEVDGEREDAAASVSRAFRAVEEATANAQVTALEVQRELVERGMRLLEQCEEEKADSETRAKSDEKQLAIRLLRRALKNLTLIQPCISSAYRRMLLGFRFSTPRKMQQPLF